LGAHNLGFGAELGRVREMLVVAAAADAEVAAAWGDAVCRGDDHLEQRPSGPLLVDFDETNADALAGDGERDEDHAPSGVAAEGLTPVRHAAQGELEALVRAGLGRRTGLSPPS